MKDFGDPHESCKEHIRQLQYDLAYAQHVPIIRVEVEEGDQHGGWDRVANVVSVARYPEGLVIRVR